MQSTAFHQALDRTSGDADAFAFHLFADLVGSINPPIRIPDVLNIDDQRIVALRSLLNDGLRWRVA